MAESNEGVWPRTKGKMRDRAAGQPTGLPEISRRKIVTLAATAAGLGFAAKYAPGLLRGGDGEVNTEQAKVEQPKPPVVAEKPDTLHLLQQIRSQIETSDVSLETKRAAGTVLEDLSKVNTYLEQCLVSYEPLKNEMHKSLRARFGQMNLKPAWQGTFSSEEEFLDNQLSFVRDKKHLDSLIQTYANGKGYSAKDFAGRIVRLRDPDGHIGDSFIDRNLPTGDTPGFFIDIANSSGQVAQRVQDVSKRLPSLSHIDVKFTTQPSKESVGAVLNLANSNDSFLQIEMNSYNVGQNPDLAEYGFLHEDGHAKNVVIGSEAKNVLPRYLSPEALVKLYYEELKVYGVYSYFGAHPRIDRIFRAGRRQVEREGVRGMLSEEQFSDIISQFSDRAWLGQTINSKGVLKKAIFDERFLPLDAASNVIDEYKSRALEGGKASRKRDLPQEELDWLNTYDYAGVEEFLKGEVSTLDKLAASNNYWKVGLQLLSDNAHRFRNYRLWSPIYDYSTPLPMEQAPSTWYSKGLPSFVNLLFCEAFFNNDRRVVDLFTEAEKKEIIVNMILLENFCQEEEFADGYALTIYSGTDSFKNGELKNPYKVVVDVAASVANKTS